MRRLLIALLMLGLAGHAFAQETPPAAILVADDVYLTPEGQLIAQGNVEALQGTTKLRARQISFDRTTGKLQITGPIVLIEGDSSVILADAAELDRDLQNGLLTGARMVLDQQLQLAALNISRVGGRYTQLYKTAVTSCRVCNDGRPPLWQIRAKRVIHDQLERQLYFDDAQFRILDMPVLRIPRLRLPDPTLKRATGFLVPSIRTTSRLGFGVKVPYFFRLGDHRDLTLTPYLSGRTTTLEYRYRQAFRTGRIEVEGAFTRDKLRPGTTRGYIFGQGAFDLKRGYKLTFDIEATSDDAYLLHYGYSTKDRLDSEIAVTRTKRDKFVQASLTNFNSLRDGENDSLVPTIVGDALYERRLFPTAIGGEVRLSINAHSHYRTSDANMLGRDVTRLNTEAHWLRGWTFGSGLRADVNFGVAADMFRISQDSTYEDLTTQVTPQAAVSLSYPMVRQTARRVTHYLEPIVQLGWTGGNQPNIPNDESSRVEFDEGNLLSLSRFPVADRRERGAQVAIGLNWSRFDPAGWTTRLSFGQVVRQDVEPDFSRTSGLSATTSDFLLAGQITNQNGLELSARGLFNDKFSFSKAEVRADWLGKRSSFGGSYVWLVDDPAEARLKTVSAFSFDGSYKVNNKWTASANWRYDLIDERAASAGVGLIYRNECVEVDLSVRRRYTSSSSVEPSTDIGFSVALRGFKANNGTEKYVRSCGK